MKRFLPAILAVSLSIQANAQTLDETACDAKSPRETAIYVDDMDMVTGDIDWALTLAVKLTATMMPGEKLAIIQLSTANGTSSLKWQGCWPITSGAKSPTEVVALQVQFSQQVNEALLSIHKNNSRPINQVTNNAEKPKHKEILAALASDIARYVQTSRDTVRAVIYSDMAENSNQGSVFSYDPKDVFGNNLNVFFIHGYFYSFGLGKNVINDPNFNQQAIQFWQNSLKSLGGVVGRIGSAFDVPSNVPKSSFNFNVNITLKSNKLDGKLNLMVDKEHNLVDSWIGISRLTAASLNGSFVCNPSNCVLHAKTNSGLIGYDSMEWLDLSGKNAKKLDGTITLENKDKFAIEAHQR